jgi:hypothetical protein
MTLILPKGLALTKPAGSWLVTPTFYGFIADADARDYLRRLHAAEGQTLEPAIALAIESFVTGCKTDNIWSALKATCILAGARTLAGALVPLVGAAPTNFNFVAEDYNRKTGLLGDGSTKYLDSNRNNNVDPQDSNHNAVYITTPHTGAATGVYIGSSNGPGSNNIGQAVAPSVFYRNRTSAATEANGVAVNFLGTSRGSSSSYTARLNGNSTTVNLASDGRYNEFVLIFARGALNRVNGRLAFYSIGESLDLALFDARVTALLAAIDAAI